MKKYIIPITYCCYRILFFKPNNPHFQRHKYAAILIQEVPLLLKREHQEKETAQCVTAQCK